MSSHNRALLEWRPVLQGRDVEETRAYLRAGFGKDLQFEPARGEGARTDVRIEGIDLPSMLIHHVRSATGSAIEGSLSGSHVVIVLPTCGCIETSAGGFNLVCDPHHAVIFPPAIPCLHAHRDTAAALCLRLSPTALPRAEKPVAPRDVKRAIDYMQAKLGSPIGIADIAEASGIAGRTLFKHFQDFHGISPMQYLRSTRFEKVREALRRAEPEESVTEIAMSWGFSHMGRFSVQYRQRFGERPSETLRRSRRRV